MSLGCSSNMLLASYKVDQDLQFEPLNINLSRMDCTSMYRDTASLAYKDESVSPDSDIMLTGQKKDKTCLVCGDKALGCNFNAVSCESCKAFFRRNAHKTIRGRCEGKCDVNIESRSFCKRCRLAKCFTVGMRKDMILDDDQKRVRKQKILINKLRRHGSASSDDITMLPEADMKGSSPLPLLPKSEESLRKLYPNLTEQEIDILCDKKPELDTKPNVQMKVPKIEPWSDVKESVFEILEDLEEEDKKVLFEMNKAHESSCFLSNTETKLKNLPNSATDMFNIADGFVRRIIKVAKQLEYFRSVEKDDQIALLKGSVVEIMMLRSAVNFDVKSETWNLSTTSCIKKEDEAGTSAPGLDIAALRKAAMEGADLATLRNMARGGANQESQPPPPPVDPRSLSNPYLPPGALPNVPNPGLDRIRDAASAVGMDINSLRKAAMGGASFEQLSKMARAKMEPAVNAGGALPVDLTKIKQEASSSDLPSPGSSNSMSIGSEILKSGNMETKNMFLTYSKFIRSLMMTIFGDLIILKFLIMLSLFSPDRPGLVHRDQISHYQEIYAHLLQKYILRRFPNEKNMFARCVMKITDLRNVNEIHTKMLQKMHIEHIEPLLVEIFDLS